MRKIGISDIEDIALGAALLGAGGGGDPYIGKLLAIGAVKKCGEVSLIDVDELCDDDIVVPVASVGAPTILTEKGVGSNEFTKLIDMVGSYYGKKITAIMPIEAGGVNSMLPIAAAARLGLPMVDVDGMGRAFPEIQMVTFTIGGVSASPMLFIDEKGNMGLMETINNKWVENICRAGCTACGGSVVSTEYVMTASQVREFGVRGIVTRSQELGRAIRGIKSGIASVSVETLICSGLLERTEDERDRRKHRLKLTEQAAPIVADGQRMQKHFSDTLRRNVTEDELRAFRSLTEKLEENLACFGKKGTP